MARTCSHGIRKSPFADRLFRLRRRLDAFPPPADLRARYRAWKGLDPQAEQIVLEDYFDDGSGKAPRYYQVNAVNAAIEAIAKGRDRVLLVMTTGTGTSAVNLKFLSVSRRVGHRNFKFKTALELEVC